MVEEFFMNKNAKKTIDFTSALNETKETIPHLLLQYAPYVHPKFLLKRKDITKEILNAVDVDGNTPLLHVAARNNIHTISHILSSKAVKDNKMLNLGVKNKAGKTVLHYLVDHKDEENFRAFLDREELTSEVANLPDNDGRTPMVYCLTKGSPYMARDILEHPTAKNKFRLDLCHTADGRSPLHLVAEQGNALLWQLAVERPDCDLTARDAQGNTPLMRAAISGRDKILGVWLKDKENATKVDQSVVNKENKTLVRLFVEHLPPRMLKLLLSTIDAKGCIDNVDTEGNTTLLAATKLGKWKAAKEILFNFGLKVGDNEEDAEGVVDVHPADKTGISALTLMMVATVKLARQEQTFSMKKQRVLANEAKQEQADIWDVVKLMLIREKEQHGTSMTQGRDGGSECIKKQLSHAKIIKPQIVDEVVQEFAKQYQFIKRKKPPTNAPAPVNPTTSTSAVPAPTPTPTTASVMVSAMTKSVSVVATSAPVPTPKSAPTSASVVATSASAPVPAPKSAPASVVATSASSGSVPAPKSAPTPASVVATSASAPIPAPKSAPASVVATSVSSASVPAPKSAPASVIATYASAPVPAPKSAPTPAPSTAPKENVPEAPTPATGSITPPSITPGGVTTTLKAPPNTANAPSQFIKNLSQASTTSSSTAVTRSTTIAKTASITTAAPSSSKADENPKQAINGSHQPKENGIAKEKFVGVDQQPKPPPRDELIKTSKENAAESKLANESVKPSAPAAVEKPKNDLPKTLLIPGRKEIESTPSSPNTETADEFSAMPSVPARRSKKKFAEASTQTESVKGCECCCTCGRGKNNA
jgi:ankyrin repeat protein